MAINTSLLVQAAILQTPFVDDSTGEVLSAGVITLYQDNSRTFLKNWYYQVGSPGPTGYTYIPLPNPMTLSAGGTPVDVNGNDIIPFFYPFSESDNITPQYYYVTAVNSDGQDVFIRQRFPWAPSSSQPDTGGPTNKNLILNNVFWRNGGNTAVAASDGSMSVTLTTQTQIVLAPSQHDGFSFPDFQFFKNVAGAVETVTFQKFPFGSTPFTAGTDVTPEYYLNHNCTGATVSGETYKYYQFPISYHLNTLDNVKAIFTIQGQNVQGAPNGKVTIGILQYLGTGPTASPAVLPFATINLTNSWEKYNIPFTFPTTQGLTPSSAGDDAIYLQIGLPVNATCNINLALPGIYLSTRVPTNDFNTYDQIDTIINSWRTGDVRTSINSFAPFGWVPANDGTIGSAASGAVTRANIDTWPLYNLIWNNIPNEFAPVVGSMTRGASAYVDFATNHLPISLTKNLGRVLMGANPAFHNPTVVTVTITPLTVTFPGPFIINGANTYVGGEPVQFSTTGTLPSGLAINTTYYVTKNVDLTATTFDVSLTLALALNGNATLVGTGATGTNTVTNTTNALTLASAPTINLTAGTPVVFSNAGGALPSGLTAGTVYYVTSALLTTTKFTVSDNLEDAENGNYIGIQTAGTGVQTVSSAIGAFVGNSYTTDVPNHMHPFTSDSIDIVYGGPPATIGCATASGQEQFHTGAVTGTTDNPTGGVYSISLNQPSSMMNVFLKL